MSARWIARFSSAAAVGGGGGSLPRVLGLDLVDARRQLEPEPGERVAALDRAHVVAIEPVQGQSGISEGTFRILDFHSNCFFRVVGRRRREGNWAKGCLSLDLRAPW